MRFEEATGSLQPIPSQGDQERSEGAVLESTDQEEHQSFPISLDLLKISSC